jgi:hypothetical protein
MLLHLYATTFTHGGLRLEGSLAVDILDDAIE